MVKKCLDVLLIFLYRSLLLLDQEFFGGGLALGVVLGQLGDLGVVLDGDLLERFHKDVSPKFVADDIYI